jgi:lysophospholipase L1-like esterase
LTSDPNQSAPGEPAKVKDSWLARHAGLWLIPLSVLFAVLLLEGVLRLFPTLMPVTAQQRVAFLTSTGSPKTLADPYLGYRYPPFLRTEQVSRDFSYTIKLDEHGFRNPSPWPDHADIVVAGDSMAFGYGVAKNQAWPTLLEDALPGHRVITLGMPGAVPRQYTRYFERFGVPLRPKVLVYVIFAGNDIREAPVFDRWLAAGSPGNYDTWRYFQGKPPVPGQSILEHSYLALALGGLRKSIKARFSAMTIHLSDGGKLRLAPGQYQSTIKIDNPGESGFDSVVSATRDAKALADAIGCHIVVVFVPVAERVYLPQQGVDFPRLSQRLEDTLKRDPGMAVFNLGGPFIDLATKGRTLYFEVDGHPNVLGNKVIADALAQYLRTNARSLGLDDPNQPDPQSDLARPR